MMQRFNLIYSLLFISLLSTCYSQQSNTNVFTDHLKALADDSVKGRKPGSPEDTKAALYIRNAFQDYGLSLLGEEGFQYFDVVTEVQLGDNNYLMIDDKELEINEDYTPQGFSGNAEIEASAVFAGYGFDIHEDALVWNDYKDLDVKGKWVVILKGDPEPDSANSMFIPYSDDHDKVITAIDKGAAGIIFISGVKVSEKDELESVYFDKSQSEAAIPVIQIKRETAVLLLNNRTIESLENKMITSHEPISFQIPTKIKGITDVIPNRVTTQNVVALIEGSDPVLKKQFIVLGAHYDHLGMGGPGSGSRFSDSLAIHNGADDNASGVAGIIELAKQFSENKKGLKQSIVFIAFGAEELGLIGSKYFTQHPLVDIDNIHSMINFDMIGRLDSVEKYLTIGGTGTSKEA
ncbi:M20/M25/M40 family metallo-hydrolase, partial [candidate division KSB1 bacterium]